MKKLVDQGVGNQWPEIKFPRPGRRAARTTARTDPEFFEIGKSGMQQSEALVLKDCCDTKFANVRLGGQGSGNCIHINR